MSNNSLAAKLSQTSAQNKSKVSPMAPDDANRVASGEIAPAVTVIDKNLTLTCNLSLSGKRYHERMLRIVSGNLPGKIAGSASSIMRKALIYYLEGLVQEHGNYLDKADLEEFRALLAYAKQNEE